MHLRKLTPSTSLLQAFEAAARHRSFTKAAEELCLTQSAISRQVQSLESLLQTRLFERSGRTITLTPQGEIYAQEINGALIRIRRASMRVYGVKDQGAALQLAVLPIFASKWLMPRLSRFYDQHPDALINLHAQVQEFDLVMSNMDACIMMGDGHWPSLVKQHLIDAIGVVIASPELLKKQPVRQASDLLHHQLLQITSHFPGWKDCLLASGVDPRGLTLGPKFEYTAHLIQAAVSGLGLGLVADIFVREELQNGTIVTPDTPDLVHNHKSYYLLHTPEKESHPTLTLFKDWLLKETMLQHEYADKVYRPTVVHS